MSKKSKAIRLGIDFGTTRTVVAAVENGNYPVCSFSWEDEVKEYIPTLAAVDRGKLLLAGRRPSGSRTRKCGSCAP